MNQSYAFNVPKNTKGRILKTFIITSTVGILQGGEIFFPDGCAGLVGVRLLDRGFQFFPYSSGWAVGNNKTLTFGGRQLEGSPWIIYAIAYNTDDTHDHAFRLSLDF